MTQYRVKKIDISKVRNTNDYWDAVNKATIHYCNGLKELKEYCGGRLYRQRNGYAGAIGNIEYVAERI